MFAWRSATGCFTLLGPASSFSQAAGQWTASAGYSSLPLVAAQLCYTFVLVIGIRAAYKGPQMWKVMSRTSSVFMITNVLVGISTLGFVY
jgi:hypothetical protein